MANFWHAAAAVAVAALLGACSPEGGLNLNNLDPDLRGWGGGGLDTAPAAAAAAPRPAPDSRGIITYPGYQVAIARQGDTVAAIAARLGLNAAQLASYNAIDAAAPLNAGAVVALPGRVAPGTAVPAPSGSGAVTDPFAGQGMKQPNIPGGPAPAATQPAASQPRQHVVVAGETADLLLLEGIKVGEKLPVAAAAPTAATSLFSSWKTILALVGAFVLGIALTALLMRRRRPEPALQTSEQALTASRRTPFP